MSPAQTRPTPTPTPIPNYSTPQYTLHLTSPSIPPYPHDTQKKNAAAKISRPLAFVSLSLPLYKTIFISICHLTSLVTYFRLSLAVRFSYLPPPYLRTIDCATMNLFICPYYYSNRVASSRSATSVRGGGCHYGTIGITGETRRAKRDEGTIRKKLTFNHQF